MNIYIIGIISFAACIIMGGLFGFIIWIVGFGWYWVRMSRRGSYFLRAVTFLACIRNGANAIEANRMATEAPIVPDEQAMRNAMVIVEYEYNGSQLALIAHAEELGFKHEEWSIKKFVHELTRES